MIIAHRYKEKRTMETFVVFFRGINVGGRNKVRMAHLKDAVEALGFANIRTYIQSGNMLLDSGESPSEATTRIQAMMWERFGLEIAIWARPLDVLRQILDADPFLGDDYDPRNKYYTLLGSTPDPKAVAVLMGKTFPTEVFRATPECVYLYCRNGYGRAKLTNNLVEKILGVTATTRNLATLRAMCAL